MGKALAVTLALCCLCGIAGAQGNRVLTGRVLDAQGNPVAGAQVYHYPNVMLVWSGVPSDRLPQATTDGQGRYRLTTSSASVPVLSAVVAFHPQFGCSVTSIAKTTPREVRLQPLKEFQGSLIDEEGKPVAGATVRLAYISLPGEEVILAPPVAPFLTTSDTQGAFRLPAHTRMTGLLLFVHAPGYAPYLCAENIGWEKVSKEGLQLRLMRGARITGQLVYAHNNEPVQAYPVFAEPASYATTDQNGRFTLDVSAGAVKLMPGFSADSATLVPPGIFAPVNLAELQPGVTTDVGIVRVYTEPVVSIEVRDEDGKPVGFCAVEIVPAAERPSGAFRLPYFTDGTGRLRLPLPDGEYTLTASAVAADTNFYTSREPQRITVRDGKVAVAQPVVITVTATRIISQRQVRIPLRNSRGKVPTRVWAQYATSTFELIEDRNLELSPYRMEGNTLVMDVGFARTDTLDRLIIVETDTWDGAVLRNMHIKKPAKGVRLQPLPRVYGRVLDSDGKPALGARVRLVFGRDVVFSDGSGRVWVEMSTPIAVNTDRAGRYSLPLIPEGRCWAVVIAQGHEPAAVVLRRGQAATVRLRKATAEYAGVLVDDYGAPVGKTRINLRFVFPESRTRQNKQQRRLPAREVPFGSITTDERGRFALRGMPSSLIFEPHAELPSGMRFQVTPSRELVLVQTARQPAWIGRESPSQPDVEKLLRAVEWLQPVQWQGKHTLLVFTAPHVPGNQFVLGAAGKLRDGWQMVIVLDTTSRTEAEDYGRHLGADVPIGYWRKAADRPMPPLLPVILPSLPYVVHLGEDGKPQRLGLRLDEVLRL